MFRQYSRPFDPTASSLQNLIIAEKRPIAELGEYVFIPSHGSYYVDTLVVSNGTQTLERNKDYRCILLNKNATMDTGKEVAVLIQILRTDIQDVYITYQAVGGKYQNLSEIILSLKGAIGSNMVSPIKWGDIVNKPSLLLAAPHYHPYWEIDDWTKVVEAIKKIELSILYKKQDKYKAVLEYADEAFRDLMQTLKGHMQNITTAYNETIRNLSPPVGYVTFSTRDLTNTFIDYRKFPERGDSLIYAVKNNADILKKFTVSEDMVYPYPDNVLLTENDFFLLRDVDKYIFLDNEKDNKFIVSDYWEEVDEQFDATFVRAYIVQNRKLYPRATITLNENLTTQKTGTLSIEIEGYNPGLGAINYSISGIHSEHIDMLLSGTLNFSADGRYQRTINILTNSRNQLAKAFTLKLTGGVEESSITVQYDTNTGLIAPFSIRAVNPVDPLNKTPVFYRDSVLRFIVEVNAVDEETQASFVLEEFTNLNRGKRQSELLLVNPNTDYIKTVDFKELVQYETTGPNTRYATEVYANAEFSIHPHTVTKRVTPLPVEVTLSIVDANTLSKLTRVRRGQKFRLMVNHKRGSKGVIYNLIATSSAVTNALDKELERTILMGKEDSYLSEPYSSTAAGELSLTLVSSISNERPIRLTIPFE